MNALAAVQVEPLTRTVHHIAGLPRSGSTLLASLLAQNPQFYCTATSPLLPMLRGFDQAYEPAALNRRDEVQKFAMMRGMVEGSFEGVSANIVFDKNRMWAASHNLRMARALSGASPKVLCCVRSLPEILASFILLMRASDSKSVFEQEMMQRGLPMTDDGRCRHLMGPGGNTSSAWHSLKDGFDSDMKECLFFVEYEDLTAHPQRTLDRIHEFLGEVPFKYDFDNIKNPVPENDGKVYGLPDLHKVRLKLENRHFDAKTVLGPRLFNFYSGGTFWRGPDPVPEKVALDFQLEAFERGDFEAAEKFCEGRDPADDRAAFNAGWYELRKGKLLEGMRLIERGRVTGFDNKAVFGEPPPTSQPLWDGSSLEGKTILLALEGGFGDQICNSRFARDLSERGAKVILSGRPELAQLLLQVEGVSAFVQTTAAQGVYHDCWYGASSVIVPLGYEYGNIRGDAFLPRRPRHADGRLRVGIRWAGLKDFANENKRRLNPEDLFSLADISPKIQLVSLQRDDPVQPPSHVKQPALHTWPQTAEAISSCDVVVSSCTSTAHLAAAMGTPTFIGIPLANEYYLWAMPGESAVWYDSVRLMRQEQLGDWSHPLAVIRQRLEAMT